MSSYLINGGTPIGGTVRISGNKNAALPCLCATLLTDSEVVLSNIPEIEDTSIIISLLKSLGSSVEKLSANTFRIRSGSRVGTLDPVLVEAVRGSILLAGAMAGYCDSFKMSPPGGDIIGYRRLDTHFLGFKSIGIEAFIDNEGMLNFSKKDKGGNVSVFLDETSVTATENLIMASALRKGETEIVNAASEPHIQDLCRMLMKMGLKIDGIGSNLLRVHGVEKLNGCSFEIGPDFMEAGSFIGLAGASGGEILIENIKQEDLRPICSGFEKIGITWKKAGDTSIIIPSRQSRVMKRDIGGRTAKVDDSPWPGFPADLLSIITVTATQMKGSILIHEKMFESRMFFIDSLIRMGSDIILCDPHRAIVTGPSRLKGALVASPDVRAGMALVIAAIVANGETEIQNIYQIERGYENLENKLRGVGVSIKRV